MVTSGYHMAFVYMLVFVKKMPPVYTLNLLLLCLAKFAIHFAAYLFDSNFVPKVHMFFNCCESCRWI